jgi:hypothetical protein
MKRSQKNKSSKRMSLPQTLVPLKKAKTGATSKMRGKEDELAKWTKRFIKKRRPLLESLADK